MYQRGIWRSFVSLGTLLSGIGMLGVWSIQFDLRTGVFLVLLLYAHEAGHVLAAMWQRIPVTTPPLFIPGFGAFVTVGGSPKGWTQLFISLGGPVVGGVTALAVKLAGVALHDQGLAFAGSLALLINLINLLPFPPLDGGRIVMQTGWIGLVPTVLVGVAVLATGHFEFAVLAGVGVVQGYKLAARGTGARVTWGNRFAMFGVYAATALSLWLVISGTDPVMRPRPVFHPWTTPLQIMVGGYIGWMLLLGPLAHHAWSTARTARGRYIMAALLGWPSYLIRDPWGACFMWIVAAHTLGIRTLPWLDRLIRHLAGRGQPAAGRGAAWGYDCLRRQGRLEEAEAWLRHSAGVAGQGAASVMQAGYAELAALKYRQQANSWLLSTMDPGCDPAALPPVAANNCAWVLFKEGRYPEALPYANAALSGEPDNSAVLDTLGQVFLAIGDATGAESALRRSLAIDKRGSTRAALARAVAAQGRYAEAAHEAELAVTERDVRWPDDEPGADEVRQLAVHWRHLAAEVQPA